MMLLYKTQQKKGRPISRRQFLGLGLLGLGGLAASAVGLFAGKKYVEENPSKSLFAAYRVGLGVEQSAVDAELKNRLPVLIENVENALQKMKKKSTVEVRDTMGRRVGHIGEGMYYTRYNDLPTEYIEMLIAAEDRTFRQHNGLSPKGVLAAAGNEVLRKVFTDRMERGSATLTEQVCDNLAFRSYEMNGGKLAKATSMSLALVLERYLEQRVREENPYLDEEQRKVEVKRMLLTLYATYSNHGAAMPDMSEGMSHGLAASAQRFFGKTLEELSDVEAGVLAVMPVAPTNFEDAKNRYKIALHSRVENLLITEGQERQLLSELKNLELNPNSQNWYNQQYLHLLWAVGAGNFPTNEKGVVIDTPLNSGVQKIIFENAEEYIQEHWPNKADRDKIQYTITVQKADMGEIIAYVGNPVNQPQAASTVKPLLTTFGIQNGLISQEVIDGEELLPTMSHYTVIDGDREFPASQSDSEFYNYFRLEDTLAPSHNSPAVINALRMGGRAIAHCLGRLFGTPGPNEPTPEYAHQSMRAIGAEPVSQLDLTNAYTNLVMAATRERSFGSCLVRELRTRDGKYLGRFRDFINPFKEAAAREVIGMLKIPEKWGWVSPDKNPFERYLTTVIRGKAIDIPLWGKSGTEGTEDPNNRVGHFIGGTFMEGSRENLPISGNIIVGVSIMYKTSGPSDTGYISGLEDVAPLWRKIIQEIMEKQSNFELEEK